VVCALMSLLKVKPGAVVPRTLIIAAGVVNAANSLGLSQDMLITSGNDSTHMKGSKHFLDWALDFRTKHLTATQKQALADTAKKRLGREYDVILESVGKVNEHLHVEYDPA
jgi:hypothetical protein